MQVRSQMAKVKSQRWNLVKRFAFGFCGAERRMESAGAAREIDF